MTPFTRLGLRIPGVWTIEDNADGAVRLDEFGESGHVWLRATRGKDILLEAAGAGLERLAADASSLGTVRRDGDRVWLCGPGADDWVVFRATRRVAGLTVHLGWHDRSGLTVEQMAERGLAMLDELDPAPLLDVVREAESPRPIEPALLLPWLAPCQRVAEPVRTLPNGLDVHVVEQGERVRRYLASDHPLRQDLGDEKLLFLARLNVLRGGMAGALPMGVWRLGEAIDVFRIGPHPLAHCALWLPDLRPLVEAHLGDVAMDVHFFSPVDLVLAPTRLEKELMQGFWHGHWAASLPLAAVHSGP